MNEQLAKQIITEALNLAMQRGCYDLTAATNIINALSFINQNNFINQNDEQPINDK